jgi:8-oxo-dGTP diphosphatase
MTEPYVTTGAAARAVGVSLTTLQRWAHAGLVQPALRTAGGHFRWDIASLRAQLRTLDTGHEPTAMASASPGAQPIVAAIVTSARGVLVGRRNDGKPPWTFIAGEIEPGERAEDAAVREVKEETGLLVAAGEVVGERVHPKTHRRMIYMTAAPTHGTSVFVGDEAELAEVRWVGLAEADELLPGMFEPVRAHLVRVLSKVPGSAD